MRRLALALGALLLGCGALGRSETPVAAPTAATTPSDATAPPLTPTEQAPMQDPARLDWSLALDGARLKISYTVTNTSQAVIYLSDILPIAGQGSFVYGATFINVTAGAGPGDVRFVRGRLDSVAPLPFPLDPGARSVQPGASASGEALVDLPLRAQHYRGVAAPLQGEPRQAWLELGYLTTAHWTELALADGRKMTTSMPQDEMRFLVAGPLAIPTP